MARMMTAGDHRRRPRRCSRPPPTAAHGNGCKAWSDRPDDPKLEMLHESWIDSGDPAEQKRLTVAIKDEVFSHAPHAPLGQYVPLAAWRKAVTEYRQGPVPV